MKKTNASNPKLGRSASKGASCLIAATLALGMAPSAAFAEDAAQDASADAPVESVEVAQLLEGATTDEVAQLKAAYDQALADESAAQSAYDAAQADWEQKSGAWGDAIAANTKAREELAAAEKNLGHDDPRYAKGTLGFFESVGASSAVAILKDPGGTSHLGDELANTKLGDDSDATSLKSMKKALEREKRINDLRVQDGLVPLQVSDTMCAMSEVMTNYASKYMGHAALAEMPNNALLGYTVGENLAWRYADPFTGWYDAEKVNYEKDMADGKLDGKDADGNAVGKTGHYLNIVMEDYRYVGVGYSPVNNTDETSFTDKLERIFNGSGNKLKADPGAYSFDAYYDRFMRYYDDVVGELDPKYQQAVDEAQAAVDWTSAESHDASIVAGERSDDLQRAKKATKAAKEAYEKALASMGQQPGEPAGPDAPNAPDQPSAPDALASPTGFTDVVAGVWYEPGVAFCKDKGMMTGIGGTTEFGVGRPLTRAQLATMLWRHAEPEAAKNCRDSDYNRTDMQDIKSHTWYTAAANWAVKSHVINGFDNGDSPRTFEPDGEVTLDQMCTILANYRSGQDLKTYGTDSLSLFTDGEDVPEWAAGAVSWCVNKGLVEGYENADGTRTLGHAESISRERVATIVQRAFEVGIL